MSVNIPEGWFPMESAPYDQEIIGLYENEPEGVSIQWAETRQCMLAGIGGGNGYYGPGWEDTYNRLIVDDPLAWKPLDALKGEK